MINMHLRSKLKVLLTGWSLLSSIPFLFGQDSNGGEIFTKESYLYGRFEVVMQSAQGSGIVSSFFLYNVEAGKNCTWPQENNEIDIEMTGNNEQIYFTTHHPDAVQPWYYGEDFYLNFNPHTTLKKYAIEWEPEIVRWFVEDQLIYVQNEPATTDLKYPMAIFMNLWASATEAWVGIWDPSVLPQQARYEYVKYYSYTPGQGNSGTNNNFTLEWQDNFDKIDTTRWEISDFKDFGSLCTLSATNVKSENGNLVLTLDEPQSSTEIIPVTFSVNMKAQNLLSTDKVYLNGTFNNWCGSCNLMTDNNGIWSLTLDLPPQKYEYLFTVNIWDQIGNAPIGSACDYLPCDEYANYGVHVAAGNSAMVLDTVCWQQCVNCANTATIDVQNKKERKLLKIYDLYGREVEEKAGQVLFYLYDDRSVEKRFLLREE